MLNGYGVLTITHRHATLAEIGQVKISAGQEESTLALLKAQMGWEELMYVATCNRVLYCFYGTPAFKPSQVAESVLSVTHPEFLTEQQSVLADKMCFWQGGDAVRHILEVTSALDSMVLGEREIIRQMREGYETSRAWGLTNDHLRLLMRFTMETAKAVTTQTDIGKKALSVVALAFQAAIAAGLKPQARILLIGAGQTNALVGKFLAKYGFRNVTVFNRTLEKAVGLAEKLGGTALPLAELKHWTKGFDALFVCTGATEPIITPALYAQCLGHHDAQPKIVVDLAVPNNVAAEVAALPMVHYIQVEDLRSKAAENLALREAARHEADLFLNQQMRAFRDLWHQRQVERALQPMVAEIKAIRQRTVTEVFGPQFQQLDPAAQALVQDMLAYMEKKCVAVPMRTVKEIASDMQQRLQKSIAVRSNPHPVA